MFEVIATNKEDLQRLTEAGIQRVELCEQMREGGLTPSKSLIKDALAKPFQTKVMLRSTSRSFNYESTEVLDMKRSLYQMKKLGVRHVVFGALTRDGKVDIPLMNELFINEDFSVTFHRAIDESNHYLQTIKDINALSYVTHILTSGGTGIVLDNLTTLKLAIPISRKRIILGSGITETNVPTILEALNGYPFDIHMGSGVRENGISIEKVQRIQRMIDERKNI